MDYYKFIALFIIDNRERLDIFLSYIFKRIRIIFPVTYNTLVKILCHEYNAILFWSQRSHRIEMNIAGMLNIIRNIVPMIRMVPHLFIGKHTQRATQQNIAFLSVTFGCKG